ncbi:MAG: hypothetical protein PHQ58_19650 [Rhodoferax sp.]|nr:hypothetical protein [Rhodoferax sp.]
MTTTHTKTHWSGAPLGLWYRWRGYAVRWILFGLAVSVFQPVVDNLDQLWQQKVNQALAGLLFGAACTVVFTPAENAFNTPRVKWKTWALVIATWLIVKVTFVSTIALTGQ